MIQNIQEEESKKESERKEIVIQINKVYYVIEIHAEISPEV